MRYNLQSSLNKKFISNSKNKKNYSLLPFLIPLQNRYRQPNNTHIIFKSCLYPTAKASGVKFHTTIATLNTSTEHKPFYVQNHSTTPLRYDFSAGRHQPALHLKSNLYPFASQDKIAQHSALSCNCVYAYLQHSNWHHVTWPLLYRQPLLHHANFSRSQYLPSMCYRTLL